MARIPNTTTAEERKALHKAKMEGKKFNRENGLCDPGFKPSRNNGWRSFVKAQR